MAKAIAILNDGKGNARSEYALRADGVLFHREGFYGSYGWQLTKWSPVSGHDLYTDIIAHIVFGADVYRGCFSPMSIFRDGVAVRLPNA